jgi:hypothetical protein
VGVIVLIAVITSAAGGGKGSAGTSAVAPAAGSKSDASPASGAVSSSANKTHPPAGDVAIASCAPDSDAGWVDAKVVVTNHSSKTSNYLVTIAFTSKDNATQIDTGLVAVNNLAPGQASAPQDAMGTNDAPAAGFACKAAQVERYASTG